MDAQQDVAVGQEPITRYTLDVTTSAKGEVNVSFKLSVEVRTDEWSRLPGIVGELAMDAGQQAAMTKERYVAQLARARALAVEAEEAAGFMSLEERDAFVRLRLAGKDSEAMALALAALDRKIAKTSQEAQEEAAAAPEE